ncbi:MAG: 3-deoxy-D-manno-octulosonic acid transferase [Prevotellaceae bacterium]|nr:3-deoxy-D-manno-octulosonic acid transferase [Prevotellaceae bacterium]
MLDKIVRAAGSGRATILLRLIFGEKFISFIECRKDATQEIWRAMTGEKREVYWIHAASLGEYAVARPILHELRRSADRCVVLTFFSPTGYNALKQLSANKTEADYIFALPVDSRKNVSAFLDAVKPKKAVFIISEYWMNYLAELSKRKIPVSLISAIISEHSVFFKWYGGFHRRMLRYFTSCTVLDEQSQTNLKKLGYANAVIAGDPLFDNAAAIAQTEYHDAVIETFCACKSGVFIAGSIHDDKDLAMVAHLANKHRDTKFIFVPHEISEKMLNRIKYELEGYALLYSECHSGTDFSRVQVLIIDFIGALSRIYRYGKWAYVGGGFTRYLHSVIEPVVYGLPVAFGPCIHRKTTPRQMMSIGIGCMASSPDKLDKWFSGLKHNDALLAEINHKAHQYVGKNTGATQLITSTIINGKA